MVELVNYKHHNIFHSSDRSNTTSDQLYIEEERAVRVYLAPLYFISYYYLKKNSISVSTALTIFYIFFLSRRNSTSSAIKRPSSTWDRSTSTPTETGQTCSPTLSTRFEKIIQFYYVCNAHVDNRNAAVAAT
jgi:hypothetical protein